MFVIRKSLPVHSCKSVDHDCRAGEHADVICRRLHVLGTTTVLAVCALAIATASPKLLLWCPLIGYGAAWVGHFCFEHNRPATFKHPLYSLMGDFRMWWEVVTLRRPF